MILGPGETASKDASGARRIAVSVQSAVKEFGDGSERFRALDQVSVDIRQNEFFTLLGPSGCGKTTLLRLIAGFEQPDQGEILIDGQHMAGLPPYQRPVNTVFQSYALFPHMSVSQNIGFGLEMLKTPAGEAKSRVENMLKLVQMESMANRKPHQISGGQAQRVALARALAPNPKVLLLDEPLSALDLKLRKEMQIELKRLQHETGITFIFVTHDQEEALTMSDRIAVMNKGKILQIGSPQEIYERPNDRFVANFIGETNFINGVLKESKGQFGTIQMDADCFLEAGVPEGLPRDSRVTIAVRPEHASIVGNPDDGHLQGTIENIVYIGTDTHVHLKLASGEGFVVRAPNRRGVAFGWRTGDRVGALIADGASQVVKA
jgi:spermidine/putrescine transport system ATP-binding protein